jgi:hypothetical protein
MGKRLKFRVVKTLLNGQKTYGEVVAGFVFYPKGTEFEIIQTKRTFCDKTVIITVKIDNKMDEGYFSLDKDLYEWKVASKGTDGKYNGFYNCKMTYKIGAKNTYNISFTDQNTGQEVDPFKEDNQVPIEWKMQLQEKGNSNAFFCTKSFVIPPKPLGITVTQTNTNSIPINFDISNKNSPYVMLSVVDNYSLAQQRRPYKLLCGSDTLMKISSLPPDYNSEKDKYEVEFNTYFDNVVKNSDNYKEYFAYRYKQWFYQQSTTQIIHPSGAFRFYPYKYHTHVHTHTCTHEHDHIHWCYTTIHGKTCLDNKHDLTNPDPHNLCDNSHTHTPRNDLDDFYHDYTSHTHTASHSHAHINSGIHNHGESSEFTYNTYIGKYKYSDGSTSEPMDIGTANVSSISLSTVGFNAKYVLNPGNVEVNIWRKEEIESVINNLEGIAQDWYTDYKAICRAKWIMEKFSIKVSNGIKLNPTPDQMLYLIDGDGCPYQPFSIKVRAPEPQFVIEKSSPPNNACVHNGSATIKYINGGIPPYEYGAHNKLLNSGDTVIVNNLSYGINTIEFANGATYDVPISKTGVGITSVVPFPNTCPTANGRVTVTTGEMPGLKTFTLTGTEFPNQVFENSTTDNSCTIEGLPNGRYNLVVSSLGCSLSEQNIVVGDLEDNLIKESLFNINPILPTNATTFDGAGGVSITFENMVNNVDWVSGKPLAFRDSETSNHVTYTGIEPKQYSITARHIDQSGKTCDVSKSFTINRPQFEAKINLTENAEGLTTLVWLDDTNISATSYKFELLSSEGKSVKGEEGKPLSCKVNVKDTYKINLLYNNTVTKIYEFIYPFPAINCATQITQPKCQDDNGTIILNPSGGFGDSNFKVSTGNGVFTNTFNYTVRGGLFGFYLSDYSSVTHDVFGNPVEVNRTMKKYFNVNIPSPERVSAKIIDPNDVSCANYGNGGVHIEKFRGGSGKYNYRINDGGWLDTLTKVNNLTPGVYNLYIKDSQNGCEVLARTFTISQPDSLKINCLDITQPTCELDNGSIYAEIKGGNGLYRYQWLFGSMLINKCDSTTNTAYNLDSLKYGWYKIQIYDNKGCDVSKSMELMQYNNPSILKVQPKPVRCYGESNGEITNLSTAGTNSIKEIYINELNRPISGTITSTAECFKNLKKGTYIITAVDSIGCYSNTNTPFRVNITQPDSLYLKLGQIQPVIEKGSKTGGIQATVFGGNDRQKEVVITKLDSAWSSTSNQRNDFPFILDKLNAGSYKILATDSKGCSDSLDNIVVAEPQFPLKFKDVIVKNALCKAKTGSIEVQAEGGWDDDYSFNGPTYGTNFYPGGKFENLLAGSYIITVKDKLEATFSDTVTIYEPKDSLRSWVSDFKLPTCSNNGEIKLAFKGGTAPYQVFDSTNRFKHPSTSEKEFTVKGLNANNYIMRITDGNGCLYDLDAKLSKTQMLDVSFGNPEYPSANNKSDGSIHAVATGGVGPLEYSWKQRFGSAFAETSSSLKNIPSGHYQLTVTEKGGCSVTKTYYLPGIGDHPFEIAEIEDETSLNAKNGYCNLTSLFNNWKEFDFITSSNDMVHLNSGDSNNQFSCVGNTVFLKNLEGGTYFVSGIADDTIKVYAEFTIKSYTPFVVKNTAVENVKKIGDSNGRISLTVEGGGGENHFDWKRISPPQSNTLAAQDSPEGSILSNISAGKYEATITDKFKNVISQTIDVIEPSQPLKITISDSKNVSCKNYNNGSVILNASGGWGDYQFKDDIEANYFNGNLQKDKNRFVNLTSRSHDFSIIDMLGVVESVSIQITEPDYLRSTAVFVDSVNCKGDATGEVKFHVTGGTKPYKFAYDSNPTLWETDTVARKVSFGEYNYIFKDAHNCPTQSVIPPVKMLEPESLLFSKIDVTHTTCNTDNGKINVNLKGGTKPYRYEWYNFSNALIGSGNSIDQLKQNGCYTLKVYDKHSCYQQLDTTIQSSSNPVITDLDATAVLCYGGNTGTATVNSVKAGEPFAPYTLKWSNGDVGVVSTGYEKGTYSVKITDTNNCKDSSYFEITQPDLLRISIADSKNAHCFGYNDAFLEAKGVGGVGDYAYQWSTGETTNLIKNLYKGVYSLKLSDANKCETNASFTISEPEKLEVDLGKDIRLCPGNKYTLDGQDFATYRWSTKQDTLSKERYIAVGEEADYYLEVTDSIGCFAWDTINVSFGNDALKSDFLLSSQAILGDTLSVFELSNMVLDSLQWNYNNNAFSKVDGKPDLNYMLFLKTLKTGIYNIDLSAFSGGCISKSTKQVEIIPDTIPHPDDGDLGYKDPLIKSFSVNPNPTDGNFYASVKLREASDINLVLFSVVSGVKINEKSGSKQQEYSIGYNLSGLNTGFYLLILKAGNERRQIKIIIQ